MAFEAYHVDAGDLLRWASYLEDIPVVTNPAIARALNDYGHGVAERVAAKIAEKGDLPASEVLHLLKIREATPRRLVWELNAGNFFPPSGDWSRPWAERREKGFEKQTLVKIITMHDKLSCEICEDYAEGGPYLMAEIDEMKAKHANFLREHPDWRQGPGFRTNLIHPNCRCMLTPFASRRRLPVTFGDKAAKEELFSVRGLAQQVAGEMKIAIKAIRKPTRKR